MNKKSGIKKSIVVVGLVLIIIIALTVLFKYKDAAFTNKVEVDYSDGCKEIYINTKLVGESCEKNTGNLNNIFIDGCDGCDEDNKIKLDEYIVYDYNDSEEIWSDGRNN